jgi:hypothetical protein
MANEKIQGEGNYDAARDYDEKATKFAKDHKKVNETAQQAKDALDGPEKTELDAAEHEGKNHARP